MTRRSQLRGLYVRTRFLPWGPPASWLSLSRSALNQAQRPKCGGSNKDL
uniref:Uncharacterized protein n=1 Tax=Anguilla anguilla TaxID=7936 RepID=A0A0E9SIH7_ANGAN